MVEEAVDADNLFTRRQLEIEDETTATVRVVLPPVEFAFGKTDNRSHPIVCIALAKALERDISVLVDQELATELLSDARRAQNECQKTLLLALSTDTNQASAVGGTVDELRRRVSVTLRGHGYFVRFERSPVTGHLVEIEIEPSSGVVSIVPYLIYEKKRVLGEQIDHQWKRLFEGSHLLIGRYRYRIIWAPDDNVEEGNFEIRHPSKIKFVDTREE